MAPNDALINTIHTVLKVMSLEGAVNGDILQPDTTGRNNGPIVQLVPIQ